MPNPQKLARRQSLKIKHVPLLPPHRWPSLCHGTERGIFPSFLCFTFTFIAWRDDYPFVYHVPNHPSKSTLRSACLHRWWTFHRGKTYSMPNIYMACVTSGHMQKHLLPMWDGPRLASDMPGGASILNTNFAWLLSNNRREPFLTKWCASATGLGTSMGVKAKVIVKRIKQGRHLACTGPGLDVLRWLAPHRGAYI